MWPDIAGVRETMKIMARRLSKQEYAVLMANQYYRSAPALVFNHFSEWRAPEGQNNAEPMVNLLTPDTIKRDAKAFVTYLDAQDAVDNARKIGTNGYCLGGSFAVRTAAAVPDRIGAVVSCHGAHLVIAGPDGPH